MITVNRLDLVDARILLAAAQKRARQIGVPMCIAITDESGHIIAFERMDGGKIELLPENRTVTEAMI